ncbi:MAG: hypothetical protein U1F71_03955 [Verrucomicrobiaceae bacterium]
MYAQEGRCEEEARAATDFDPKQVAWFLNSLWQGAMLVGKACESQTMIHANLKLARSFVDGPFQKS